MPPQLLFVPDDHPLNRLSDDLKRRFAEAQSNVIGRQFASAKDLCDRALADLRISVDSPRELQDRRPDFLADRPGRELESLFSDILLKGGVPQQAITLQAANLAHRVQLLSAFERPDEVVEFAYNKVVEVVGGFPSTIEHLQRGRNPGDVLDPYILGAAQQLMYSGDFEGTVSGTVAHKVLMMIEGLLGHLHEDVLGKMRGNVRAPEPRGEDQETLDPTSNPFPGADIVQPPLSSGRPLRFHQVKSKTGSAKGGDGRRLGLQLSSLQKLYGGEIFYDALIGNTLRGHRSMRGVQRAAPGVVVLVGDAAFRELTGSHVGPQLLLRLYQSAFDVAVRQTGYRMQDVVITIYTSLRQRAEQAGEGFLETVLQDAVGGPESEQDSRRFAPAGRRLRRSGDASV